MGFLEFLETSLATFIRESDSFFAFAGFLCLHTLGLSLLVGVNAIVAIRLLGIAPSIPVKPLGKLFPFQWIGLVLSMVSGIGLAISRATFVFANWLLPVKLVLVVLMWVLDSCGAGEGKAMIDGRLMIFSTAGSDWSEDSPITTDDAVFVGALVDPPDSQRRQHYHTGQE